MKRLSQNHLLDVYTLDTADRAFCDLNEFSNAEFVFHFSPSRLFDSPLGRLNQLQRWRDLQRLDRLSRQISLKIDEGNYDVVLAQPCMWTQAPLPLRYLKTPTVYYCHEPPRHLYEEVFRTHDPSLFDRLNRIDPLIWLYRTTARRFDSLAVRSARLVLVNSIFIRDSVRHLYGCDPVISYHGVDTDLFCPAVHDRHEPYVLSVGAIQPHKGFGFLIESLATIDKKKRPPLHLIGNMESSSERNRLQALAHEKEVDLHLKVGVDQKTLIQKYRNAALVAYSPFNEPFGLVPLEAMACGKPVVGVKEGGIRETVLDQFTGLLVDRDAVKFGQAVQILLENPALAQQYGSNGRKHVLENWSWKKSIKDLEQHLCRTVQ
jgi:glycosyltransferase involved in cell wall biosynthesis